MSFIWGAIYNLAQADTITSVGQKAMPAVVSIAVLSSVNDEDALKNRIALMFLAPRKDIFGHEILNAPLQSGITWIRVCNLFKGKPYIVTNYHTVENAIKIKVTFF
ncbi:MAG: hypothetical protein H6925_01835 [Holosporaceae bacterium]|nr:MAG: hypothetical protein H6925_01835 [Holosporaceae bacterium]